MYLLTRCLVLDHNNCLSFDRTYNPFITWCEYEEVPNGALRHVEGTPEALSFSEWENTPSGDSADYYFASVSGGEASGLGSDYSWAINTQTGMEAFDVGNGVKGGLIDYAVPNSAGKSISALKRADYVATLSKTGANYVRAFKVAEGGTFGASTVISAGLATNYYMNGGTDYLVGIKSTIDIAMGVVRFLGPIGFGISATYFIIDAASDGFGGYDDPLKIIKQ